MSQTEVTVKYSEIKIRMLDFALMREGTTIRQELTNNIYQLYQKYVPTHVQEFVNQMEEEEAKRPANPYAKTYPRKDPFDSKAFLDYIETMYKLFGYGERQRKDEEIQKEKLE